MSNSTTSGAIDISSSPVTILPLILLAVVVIVILVVSCLLYRRRKQMKLLSQLKMTEKRIKVVSGFLEKTDIKEENHAIEDNRPEEVAPPTSTPQKSPPNTLPLYQLRSHLYMGPQPIYASSSEISLPDDLTGAQTSMEVHCNDTPSTVLGRARRRCLNSRSYSGLVQHYNVMGASADGLGRSCNTAVQFPLVNSLVANGQLGFRAPENTPVEFPSFTMPSQRFSYNEEDIDTSGTLVAPSQVFSLRPQYISCDVTNTDTETEVWV